MAKKIDLDTIAKEYAEGRISREDFLYLHKMLTDPTASNKKPVQQKPPVLTGGRPLKAGTEQQNRPVRRQQAAAAAQQRRTIRPGAAPPSAQSNSHAFSAPPVSLQVTPQKNSIFNYVKKHHKEAVALIGTFGIFISMFYNKIESPNGDAGNARVVVVQERHQPQTQNQIQAPRLRSQDIKLIAQLMMEDSSWNKELVGDFVAQWNRLSDTEKQTVKKTDWYSLFATLLSQQIKTAHTKAKTGDVTAIYNQQALLGLADTLVFGDDKQAKETLAKLASSDTKPNKPIEQSKQHTITGKPALKSRQTLTAKVTKQSNTADSKRHRISRKEIEDVINRFTVAFEAGHTRDLGDLFPDDDYSSSFASLDKIKKEYRKLFRTTQNRSLDFNSLFWEHDYDEARGTAEYTANIQMTGDNVKKTVTANLDITLRRLLGKVYITDFKLSDRDVVTHAPKSKSVAARKPSAKDKPKHPTPSELQDLVTQYMTAYETGDTQELMHLFANATWTKSRSGLVEMKQNYENLFTTTSGREIFVKNIKWTFKGKKALGTGELALTHHTSDDNVESQKGKIRIVATKVGDKVRFSQMFHIVD